MLRLVLKSGQRSLFADKLFDAANLSLAALVFGQFLGEGFFAAGVALLGLALWIFFIVFAAVLSGGGES